MCAEIEKRIWSNNIIDNATGESWDFEGINFDGGLKLRRGKNLKVLSRW